MPAATYPTPQGGASLILSFRLANKTVLVLGSSQLAASRAFAALEADASVVVLAKGPLTTACDEIQWRTKQGQLQYFDWEDLPGSSDDDEHHALDAFLNTLPPISLAIVTKTLSTKQRRTYDSSVRITNIFQARRIPVNTTDLPDLCDFSFTSTHRFEDHTTGEKTPLQLGITTNGQGCRLASRLKRDVVSRLPPEVGAAVKKIGRLRDLARRDDGHQPHEEVEAIVAADEINEDGVASTPNRPVPNRSSAPETSVEAKARRVKWVAQLSEYWPIPKLASLSDAEMHDILADEDANSNTISRSSPSSPSSSTSSSTSITTVASSPSLHFDSLSPPPPPRGRILLVGSGPGHPSLLTLATHAALTRHADLVLSDKLVPEAVLALIPKHVQVKIARKFPGNADGAQEEMMREGVEAARKGLTVVRLKQGDPVVYGRAGEEVLFFRSQGFEPIVVPGVSSALAAPTFASIPITQRGVAESFIVCTGVGRGGKEVRLPGYERSRTVVILMGVARLGVVVNALTEIDDTSEGTKGRRRDGPAYPLHTPIAIIERASMPDQRVILSTLAHVVRALESSGEQRPPGMMVIGWSVLALGSGNPCGEGDMSVLDEGAEGDDEERVEKWLGAGRSWRVVEGIDDEGWARFNEFTKH